MPQVTGRKLPVPCGKIVPDMAVLAQLAWERKELEFGLELGQLECDVFSPGPVTWGPLTTSFERNQ